MGLDSMVLGFKHDIPANSWNSDEQDFPEKDVSMKQVLGDHLPPILFRGSSCERGKRATGGHPTLNRGSKYPNLKNPPGCVLVKGGEVGRGQTGTREVVTQTC